MQKGFQDTSSQSQFKGFPNLNFQQSVSAYGYSGVTFWLDAAFGLNTQTDLGAVSRWQSRVGGAIFEQTTAANQPRLILNDANYNNFPSIESVDTARSMASLGNGLKFNNPNVTIAVISKVNTARANNMIIGETGATNFINDGGTFAGANGFGWYPGSYALQGNTESTNPRIKILTSTNVIVNGVSETTTGSIGSLYVELKKLFNFSASSCLTGTIAEIIAFNYAMTSDEAIDLSNRINQKYAIY